MSGRATGVHQAPRVKSGTSIRFDPPRTDRSVREGSVPQDVPDFTRGAWRTAPAYPISSFDLTKLDLSKFKPLKKTDVMDVRTGS